MGCFTWTDAMRYPRVLGSGDYASVDKIKYGGYAKIVCPDNTEIIEHHYEGYGVFDGKDVFDLVVDWNKNHLDDIFNKFDSCKWGYCLKKIAVAFQNDDTETIESEIEVLISSGKEPSWFRKEWKRSIGIAIACGEENLPFPIKITSTKASKKYDELVASQQCQ